MALHLKQSEGSATASGYKIFLWARLRLTGVYVLILAVILIGFSIFLYRSVESNMSDSVDGEFTNEQVQTTFIDRTLKSIANDIVLVDIVILVATGGLSYFLAGYTLRPIQRSLEAQRVFSENASHELRTPLAVMKNEAEVLLRNPNPTKDLIQKNLRSTIEETDHMTKIAEELLMLARSENHRIHLMGKIDIADIMRKITEKTHTIAEHKGVKVSVTQSVPIYVRGNITDLERAFMNLLQNAFEHTSKDGSVMVDVAQEKSGAIIKVSDTGSGILEKDLPHVFERFYKGESSLGSGLGLSIVKGIVDQHGGKIDIESVTGKGTTVIIKLPVVS